MATKHKPLPIEALSYSAYLQKLIDAGLSLIPVTRGRKTTTERDWQKRGETNVGALIRRGIRLWGDTPSRDDPAREVFATGFNVGVLNGASRTITVDLDDPAALAAIEAGMSAIGSAIGDDDVMAWDSVKGRKLCFKAPAHLAGKYAKLIVRQRLPNDTIDTRCVFELRGTGYDLMPMSHRDDEDYSLRWVSWLDRVPPMPDEWVELMEAMLNGRADVIHAMKIAAGCDPAMLGNDGNQESDYPPALLRNATMRMAINGLYSIPDLLNKHGFIQHGTRWIEPGSSHADGIRQMKGAAGEGGLWICFHASSRIAGQFDAWRLFVEYEHDGNIDAAIEAARILAKPRIADRKKAAPPAKGGAAQSQKQKTSDKSRKRTADPVTTATVSLGRVDMSATPKPVAWLTEGLIRIGPGVYMLAGKPKSGKSWLALGLAIAASEGGTYLETKFIKACEALYLNVDDANEDRFVRRIKATGYKGDAKNLRVLSAWPPLNADGEVMDQHDALALVLSENPRIGLVVIDTFGHMRSLHKTDTKSPYDAELSVLKPYQEIAAQFGVAVILVHHLNKLKMDVHDTTSVLDSISGTSAVQGGTDGNFVLARTDTTDSDDRTAILVGRTRDSEHEVNAGMSLKDGNWRHIGPSWMAHQLGTHRMVIEILNAEPDKTWSAADVHKQMQSVGEAIQLRSVQTIMGRMKNGGELIASRGPDGGYRLAPKVITDHKARKF